MATFLLFLPSPLWRSSCIEMSCLMVSSSSFRFLATAHAMNGLTFARLLSAMTCAFPATA